MINLINVINQSSLTEAHQEQQTDQVPEQRLEEISAEPKCLCIEIESKGLAECKQTSLVTRSK